MQDGFSMGLFSDTGHSTDISLINPFLDFFVCVGYTVCLRLIQRWSHFHSAFTDEETDEEAIVTPSDYSANTGRT